jgi:hypothetical protein
MASDRRFEHYEVLQREDDSLWELGRGAMGVTYKAFDTDLHCTVALKVINPSILETEGTEQRFLREARAAAQLRHPNIATVLRLGKAADGTHFYAMEFCEGRTVQQFVEEEGALPPDLALNFALQVARALVVAEEHHVVHRDIKPANLIVVRQRGEGLVIKVIDFGLAKSLTATGNSWTSMSLATAGFIGTAHFSSPEQLEEGKVDVRSDIYSLGATLWFMLVGQPMFSGSVARVMSQHLSATPPWEQIDSLGLSPRTLALLRSMLAKDPKDRPQTALDLKEQIEVCLKEKETDGEKAAPEHSTASAVPSGDLLLGRWRLLEEHRGFQRNVYRAVDLKEGGRIVGLTMLDRDIADDPEAWKRLTKLVDALRSFPDGVVRPILLERNPADRPFVVTSWINGIPLVTLLRRRGALSWKETLKILQDVVPACDRAADEKLATGPLSKEEITLAVDDNVPVESRFDEITAKPLAEWPGGHAVVNLLTLSAPKSGPNETLLSMATMIPGRAASSSSGPTLRELARLVYELLGGTARTEGQRYTPIPRAGAGANELLKKILTAPEGAAPSFSGKQFIEQLAAGSDAIPAQPARPAPPSVQERIAETPTVQIPDRPEPSAPETTPGIPAPATSLLVETAAAERKRNGYLIPLGAAAGLVAVIGLAWLGITKWKPATKSTVVTETPTASPPPALAPSLEGVLVSKENSPKGDMRVEHRSGGWIYVISQADEAKHYAFRRSSGEDAAVVFSPDENWLLLNEHAQLNDASSRLYRRVGPDDVEFAEETNLSPAGESLTDSGWKFYLGEVGLPPETEREEIRLSSVEWKADSSGVRLRFDNYGPNGRKILPQPYVCVYQAAANQFTSESDVAAVRSSLTAATVAAATPAAAPAPPTETSWQNQIGTFVTGFIRANDSNDSEAVVNCYAPSVDYFDQGRLDQNAIRTDIQTYNARWPTRHDEIENNNVIYRALSGEEYLASYNVLFFVSSPARLECIRGKLAVTLHVSLAGGAPRITSIQQKTLQRDKGVLQISGTGFTPVWENAKRTRVAKHGAPGRAVPAGTPQNPQNDHAAEVFGRILNGLSNGRVPIPPHP